MDVAGIIRTLKSLATKDTGAMSRRRVVPEETLLGIDTAALRKLAKELGTNQKLAQELWRTPFHEAHVLAILTASLSTMTIDQLSDWVFAISSWSISDKFAKRLTEQHSHVEELARLWACEEAINLALEFMEAADPAQIWVGKCAHKELELLVKIPERRRLISRQSKTAAKYYG